MQSHRSLVLNALHGDDARADAEDSRHGLPAAHVYGKTSCSTAPGWPVGGCADDPVRPRGRDPAHEEARRHHVRGRARDVRTIWRHPALAVADLSTLTRSTVGGQMIAESVIESWRQQTDAPLIELWGMTELSGLGSPHPSTAPNIHGSIGGGASRQRAPVVQHRRRRHRCAPATPVSSWLAVPLVTLATTTTTPATAEAFTSTAGCAPATSPPTTVPSGTSSVDRLKDMILTAGYNVYPRDRAGTDRHASVALVAVGREPALVDVRGAQPSSSPRPVPADGDERDARVPDQVPGSISAGYTL